MIYEMNSKVGPGYFSMLALKRDSIIEQTCVFHPTLSLRLETFLNMNKRIRLYEVSWTG